MRVYLYHTYMHGTYIGMVCTYGYGIDVPYIRVCLYHTCMCGTYIGMVHTYRYGIYVPYICINL